MSTLHVLDLPQLYTKPAAHTLLETLTLLATVPPSWEKRDAQSQSGQGNDAAARQIHVNPEGITRYLTSIVSSSLRWIDDEDAKEEIYNQASARLSERSGRSAMGSMSRTFRIPTSTDSFELSIHEPAMTGDELGLKTWAASYLLAKRLHTLQPMPSDHNRKLRVLELGSGTGLVGLAMAGLGADVHLTDLCSICPNLARNVQANYQTISQNSGSAHTATLDWSFPALYEPFEDSTNTDVVTSVPDKFPLILAADSLYSPDHPRMLVECIAQWLSRQDDAKVIVEFPYRDAYLPQISDFRQRMMDIGLEIVDQGEENGYDDWGSSADHGEDEDEDEDDTALVTCWWSCWAWQAGKCQKPVAPVHA
ncbi:hypothetical protein J1614_009597 [Plenodomus biglobosus]|nr:hypothetical protein J1614_009597 [Plenodomus biglobosus]